MKKRLFKSVVLMVMVLFVITGCNKEEKKNVAAANMSERIYNVNWGDDRAAIEAAVATENLTQLNMKENPELSSYSYAVKDFGGVKGADGKVSFVCSKGKLRDVIISFESKEVGNEMLDTIREACSKGLDEKIEISLDFSKHMNEGDTSRYWVTNDTVIAVNLTKNKVVMIAYSDRESCKELADEIEAEWAKIK